MSWSRGAVPCTSEAARGHFIEGWAEFAMHKLGGEAAHFPHLEGQRPCPPRDQGSRNTLSANPKLGGSCGFSGRPLSRSVPSAVLYFRSRHSQVPRAPSLFPDQRPPTPRCPCTSAQGPRSGAHPELLERAHGGRAEARRASGAPRPSARAAGFAPEGSVLLLQFREMLGRLGNGAVGQHSDCDLLFQAWRPERRGLGRRGQQGGLLRSFRASPALRHLGLDVRAGSSVPGQAQGFPGLRVSPASAQHSQPHEEPPLLLLAKHSR